MEATPESDAARNQRRERLFGALAAISTVSTLPDGRIDQVPAIAELLRAADDVALHSEMEALVDEIASRTADYPDAARAIVSAARMRVNDRLIVGHGSKGLEVLRVDYCRQSAAVPELDIEIQPTVDGSITLETSCRSEELLIAFASAVQIIVQGSDDALDHLKRQLVELGLTRGRETFGLQGEFALSFGLGVGMRAAWGYATVAITNQRILGVIFNDDLAGRGRSTADEAAWMPIALAAQDLSSMIVFSLPRTAVSEVEVLDNGPLARRVPYANVHGDDYTLVLDTVRVFEADRLVRPKKNQLGDAIRALPSSPIPSSAKPVARDADEHGSASPAPRPRGTKPRLTGATKMLALSGLVLTVAALAFLLGSLVTGGGSSTSSQGPMVTVALTPTSSVSDDELQQAADILTRRAERVGWAGAKASVAGARLLFSVPATRDSGDVSRLTRPGSVSMYDWEANVIGPDGEVEPENPEVTGGPSAGRVGGISYFDAITRASEQPAAEGEAAEDVSHNGLFYLLDQDEERVVAGPEQEKEDLFTDRPDDADAPTCETGGEAALCVSEVKPGTTIVRQENAEGQAEAEDPNNAQWFVLRDRVALKGTDIENPEQQFDQGAGGSGQPIVTFGFTDEGRDTWEEVTRGIAQRGLESFAPGSDPQTAAQHFAIVLDNELVSVPFIDFQQNPDGIDGRNGSQIEGGFTTETAQELAAFLTSGPLRVGLQVVP